MRIEACYCDFCGEEIASSHVKHGHDYGLAQLDGSGHVLLEFDACGSCLRDILSIIENRFKEG